MHELGLIVQVVELVEDYVSENPEISGIEKIVLSVGEGCCVVPRLMQNAYRYAVRGTVLEDAGLEMEILSASAECRVCGQGFNPLRTNGTCPGCGGKDYTVLSGQEFEVKQLVIKEPLI